MYPTVPFLHLPQLHCFWVIIRLENEILIIVPRMWSYYYNPSLKTSIRLVCQKFSIVSNIHAHCFFSETQNYWLSSVYYRLETISDWYPFRNEKQTSLNELGVILGKYIYDIKEVKCLSFISESLQYSEQFSVGRSLTDLVWPSTGSSDRSFKCAKWYK